MLGPARMSENMARKTPRSGGTPAIWREHGSTAVRASGSVKHTAGPGGAYLSPDDSVGHQIRLAYRAFNRLLGQRLLVEKLTPAQWFFLRALWEKDGVNQRELSTSLGLTEPTTVAALRVLERRGLLRRRRDAHDRRRSVVVLTQKGRGLRDKLMAVPREVNRVGLDGEQSADIAALLATLKRIRLRLETSVQAEHPFGDDGGG